MLVISVIKTRCKACWGLEIGGQKVSKFGTTFLLGAYSVSQDWRVFVILKVVFGIGVVYFQSRNSAQPQELLWYFQPGMQLTSFQEFIRVEIWAIDKDYALGIVILVSLMFVSPVIVLLIRFWRPTIIPLSLSTFTSNYQTNQSFIELFQECSEGSPDTFHRPPQHAHWLEEAEKKVSKVCLWKTPSLRKPSLTKTDEFPKLIFGTNVLRICTNCVDTTTFARFLIKWIEGYWSWY